MSYITDPKGAQFSLFQTYNTIDAQTMCGQRFNTEDGREVVLVLNGTTALVAGVLVQNKPIVAADQGLTTTVYTATNITTGKPATLTVTAGGTVTANEYALGKAIVASGTGIGQTLKIASNTAATSTNPIIITLEDQPVVALDTSSVINLISQEYSGVVINPTTHTSGVAGATLYAIPATTGTLGTTSYVPSYGFVVTRGVIGILNQGGTAIGLGLSTSASVPGATATVAATTNQLGFAFQAGTDAAVSATFINL